MTEEFCSIAPVDDSGGGALVATFRAAEESKLFTPQRFLADHYEQDKDQQDAQEFLQRQVLQAAETWATQCSGADAPKLLCRHCGIVGRLTERETFSSISLPLHSQGGAPYRTAAEALLGYLDTRQTVALRAWACSTPECVARGVAADDPAKMPNVLHWPRVLILHLLRWDNKQIPVPHAVAPDRTLHVSGTTYALRAVVTHEGSSARSGHYVAFASRGDRWHVCDDKAVRPATESEGTTFVRDRVKGHTYLLFYEKVDSPAVSVVLD
jgi:ubiquitin C-terminal hydrolase